MNYLGLDPSTKCTGACLLGADGKAIATHAAKPLRASDPLLGRIRSIGRELDRFYNSQAEMIQVGSIAIEKPFSSQLWMLHGCLAVAVLGRTSVMPMPIEVSTVKKFVGCFTNASKADIGLAVANRFDFAHDSHDVVDAFILAHIARCMNQPDEYTAGEIEIAKKAKVY